MAHVLKKDRAWMKIHSDKVLSSQCSVKFKNLSLDDGDMNRSRIFSVKRSFTDCDLLRTNAR